MISLVGAMLPAIALAQQPVDWCSQPLPVQADPGTALVWRLRCTIQILDRERMEEVDHATTMEIDKAMSEAHLKEALDEAAALKKGKEEERKDAPPTAILPPHK